MHAQYDAGFYDSIKDRAYTSALEIAPFIHRLIEPTSVVDIGCGSGDWLAVFQSLGVQDILGFDGGAGSEAALRIPREFFRSVDFRQPIPVDRTFDLALCLEVAEHLAATDARALVQTLARLAPVILFSAAVPQQPGVHHVNCRWPEYWVTEFAKLGYEVHDSVRWHFWENPSVSWWYAQNALLFVRTTDARRYANLLIEQTRPKQALAVIHPRLYELCCDPAKVPLKRFLQSLASAMVSRIRAANPRRRQA